jgi:hypothetical protein
LRLKQNEIKEITESLQPSTAMAVFSTVIFILFLGFCHAAEDEFPRKFTLNTGFDIPAIGCECCLSV